jgi:hypothetical protein
MVPPVQRGRVPRGVTESLIWRWWGTKEQRGVAEENRNQDECASDKAEGGIEREKWNGPVREIGPGFFSLKGRWLGSQVSEGSQPGKGL